MCDLPDPLEIFEELGKVVKDFFKGVLNVFKSPFGPKINIPEQSEIDRGQIQGVLLNKDSAVASIPVVYGTRMVGGTRVFVSTNKVKVISNLCYTLRGISI